MRPSAVSRRTGTPRPSWWRSWPGTTSARCTGGCAAKPQRRIAALSGTTQSQVAEIVTGRRARVQAYEGAGTQELAWTARQAAA